MKKLTYLLFLLAAFKANAQDGVIFKMKYLPGHKYGTSMVITVNVKVSMSGNEQMLEKLKSQGITMPVAVNGSVTINSDVTTGAKLADNSYPLTIDVNIQDPMLNLNGNQIDPLKGKKLMAKLYAHNGADGKITSDSSFFDNKKDTAKSVVASMLDVMQRRVNFPEKLLKVGDTFDQNAPMNLPGGAAMVKDLKGSNIHTTYKLTSIADGKAYFDMVIGGDITMDIKNVNVSLSCNGSGKMIYSIKDNFPLSVNSKVGLKLNVTAGTMVIDGNADFTLVNTHTIN